MKNLHDLSCHSSPYSVPIIPRPLPSEIVEGEHFVVADLLSLIPDGSSLAREAESEAAGWELALNLRNLPPLAKISAHLLKRPSKAKGVAIWSVLPWQERTPVLSPEHRRKRRGVDRKFLEQGWRTSFLGSSYSPDREEEEEEEDDMSGLVHNFSP